MRLALLSTVLFSLLALATGCSTSGATQVAARGTTPVAMDAADDPAWNPPDETNIAYGEATVTPIKHGAIASLPTPNKREILTGQLRTTN